MLENQESHPIPLAPDALNVVRISREIAIDWKRDRITSHELLASLFKDAQNNPENPLHGHPDVSDQLKANVRDFYGKGQKRIARGVTPIVKKWVRDAQSV